MTIVEQINNDIKQAMLAKEKDKLEALRAVKTAFAIALTSNDNKSELTDDKSIIILQKLVKQRLDAGEIYKNQNRDDLASVEFMQAKFIKNYLPEQLSENEIEDVVKKIIFENNINSIKDMGKIMGIASKLLQGKADNKTVSEIIKKLLN